MKMVLLINLLIMIFNLEFSNSSLKVLSPASLLSKISNGKLLNHYIYKEIPMKIIKNDILSLKNRSLKGYLAKIQNNLCDNNNLPILDSSYYTDIDIPNNSIFVAVNEYVIFIILELMNVHFTFKQKMQK